MASVFQDHDWNIMRHYIYWLLQDADGKITLPLGRTVPEDVGDVYFLIQGWTFEFRLDETLRLTGDALKDASNSLAEAHRVAAAIQVNAPDSAEAEQLEGDLRALSDFVKRDQRAKALSDFFAGAADVISSMKQV